MVTEDIGEMVVAIAEDGEGEEVRVPVSGTQELELTGDFGIGDTGRIVHIKHGPWVAAQTELRNVIIESFVEALNSSCHDPTLCVDLSAPPLDEGLMDLDERFSLRVEEGRVVAEVIQNHPCRPVQPEQELVADLARVASARGCTVVGVKYTLEDGSNPAELLTDFEALDYDPEKTAEYSSDARRGVDALPHMSKISVEVSRGPLLGTLIDGASAIADYLAALRGGSVTAETVLDLLRGGHHELIVGMSESHFLEVKSQPHLITKVGVTGDKAKIELAQDVARFANAEAAAIMVIGFREEARDGQMKITKMAPARLDMIDPEQYQDVLDSRIVPTVEGLQLEQFPIEESKGLLAIFVPKQPSEMQPYLVHGAIVGDKFEGEFFSIVRRRGERSITTNASQIHGYITSGKRWLRGDV